MDDQINCSGGPLSSKLSAIPQFPARHDTPDDIELSQPDFFIANIFLSY